MQARLRLAPLAVNALAGMTSFVIHRVKAETSKSANQERGLAVSDVLTSRSFRVGEVALDD